MILGKQGLRRHWQAHRREWQQTAIFLLTVLLGLLFGEAICKFGVKNYYGFQSSLIASRRLNAEILVQGSSRAEHSIKPRTIERALGLPVYNLGKEGNPILEDFILLRMYLKYYPKPKLVLLETYKSFFEEHDLTPKVYRYLPYLDDPLLAELAAREDPRIASLSKFPYLGYARYNQVVLDKVLKGWVQYIKDNQEIPKSKGFRYLTVPWHPLEGKMPEDAHDFELSARHYQAYQEYLAFAKSEGIKVVLYSAPRYGDDTPPHENIVYQLAQEEGIPYWNFNNAEISWDTTYFSDPVHVSPKGADWITGEFVDSLLRHRGYWDELAEADAL